MNEELILNVETNSPYVIGAIAYVEQLENGAKITMVDKNGTTVATVYDGADGKSISSVTLNDDYTLTILYTDGDSTTTGSIRGATGDSGVYYGSDEPTDPDVNVWVDPADGDGSVLKIKDENEQWAHIDSIVGEAAGFGTVTATVDANHGTPAVTVTATGDNTAKNFAFAFSNLQPAPYDDSNLRAAIATDSARIDSFTHLAAGSTTGDAELIDGRTVGGITYTNIGGAIRSVYDDTSYIMPKFITGYYISSSKSIGTSASRIMSEKIPCKEGDVVHYIGETNHSAVSALSFLDSNDTIFEVHCNEGALGTEFTATAPAGTASCVVCSQTTYITRVWFSSSPLFSTLRELEETDINTKAISEIVLESLKVDMPLDKQKVVNTTNATVGSAFTPEQDGTSVYNNAIIECEAGEIYVVTAVGGSDAASALVILDSDNVVLYKAPADAVLTNKQVNIAEDGYLIVNSKIAYDEGTIYKVKAKDLISAIDTDDIVDKAVTPPKASFFELTSHNLINPDNIDTSYYWSPMRSAIGNASSDTGNALSGLIEVEEGETYTYSGTACTYTGAYFDENAVVEDGQSGTAITFFDPVVGLGCCFTVPENSGIKYVALNLVKDTSTQEIAGTYQLERGEMATDIVPYHAEYLIKEEYIPKVTITQDISDIVTLPSVSYDSVEKAKISNFIEHCRKKDKDIVVVGTGTSLTARSSEHCTTRSDASSRPPLMHSNNFASKMWDKMLWEGQQYRRFDYPDFFTETGTWASSHNLSNWDDNDYRYGITRYASGTASVAFEIPENAWQFNFIYRSDTVASEEVTVAISEGNGKVEVFNGSTWVEANGYTFSMKQATATLSNITVYNPNTEGNTTVSQSSYQVGGNTTYQKRLKMRCKSGAIDSLSSSKSVTVSSTSGRLMYWGVEWSPREFMITYINAARGSHNMSYNSERSLSHFQDNEVWDFKPDLIFTENPIHNSGGAGVAPNSYYTTYWGNSTYDFFFNADNPISFVSRATAKGLNVADIEWVLFTSSISYNFGGINDDGELILYMDKNGKVMSALDAQTLAHTWTVENKANVVAINACKYWCDAGVQLFGDMKTATLGSGKGGQTFTNEGSHWNDTGSAVIARCVGSILEFYTN